MKYEGTERGFRIINETEIMKERYTDKFKDCIHLHACRRVCAIAKNAFGNDLARGCDKDTCKAYEEVKDIVDEIDIDDEDSYDFVSNIVHKYASSFGYIEEKEVRYRISEGYYEGYYD